MAHDIDFDEAEPDGMEAGERARNRHVINRGAITAQDISDKEKILLVVLCEHMNIHDRVCNPSEARLQALTGFSSKTIHKAKVRLRDLGYLDWEMPEGRKQGVMYRFNIALFMENDRAAEARARVAVEQSRRKRDERRRRADAAYTFPQREGTKPQAASVDPGKIYTFLPERSYLPLRSSIPSFSEFLTFPQGEGVIGGNRKVTRNQYTETEVSVPREDEVEGTPKKSPPTRLGEYKASAKPEKQAARLAEISKCVEHLSQVHQALADLPPEAIDSVYAAYRAARKDKPAAVIKAVCEAMESKAQ